MRLSLNLPVLVQQPSISQPWESTATIDDVADIVVAAEQAGYHHVTCSEHVGVTTDVAASGRGTTYWDPLATFGYLAARTETIRLATNIVVLGYHHPLAIAKRYGTLDRVSGGRLILGVGVGSLKEEFDLLGASFDDRGPRTDDAMRALTAAFGVQQPEYHGEFYDFDNFIIDPPGTQTPPPMWVGGRTRRSLRRAVELGHGWCPFGLKPAEMRAMTDETGVPDGFDLVYGTGPVNPRDEPDRARAALEAMAGAGATILQVHLHATSPAHYVEQLGAMWSLAADCVDLESARPTTDPTTDPTAPGGPT